MFRKRNHKRRKVSAKVTAKVISWLDLYPPKQNVTEPKPSEQPAPFPEPDSYLVGRLSAVKGMLENDVKPNIEIREYFLHIYNTGSEVCFSYPSTENSSEHCGTACTYLRPPGELDILDWLNLDSRWRSQTAQSIKDYQRLLKEIEKKGIRAHTSQVAAWENTVEVLRKGTRNKSDLQEENGWTKKADYSKTKGDVNWTFEGAWGTQREPDEDVGPDRVLYL
jgi:hypothetical protein